MYTISVPNDEIQLITIDKPRYSDVSCCGGKIHFSPLLALSMAGGRWQGASWDDGMGEMDWGMGGSVWRYSDNSDGPSAREWIFGRLQGRQSSSYLITQYTLYLSVLFVLLTLSKISQIYAIAVVSHGRMPDHRFSPCSYTSRARTVFLMNSVWITQVVWWDVNNSPSAFQLRSFTTVYIGVAFTQYYFIEFKVFKNLLYFCQ